MRRSPRAFDTRYILACGAATSITAAWAALLVLHVGGDSASRTISNVGLHHRGLRGATGCLRGGVPRRRTPADVDLPRVRVDLVGAGQVIWTAYESYGEEVPFPSYADAGYLGLPLLAAIGLLLLPSATQTLAGRIRTVIDGMMIAGAVLLCSWVVVLDEVYAAGDDGLVTTTDQPCLPARRRGADHDRAVRAAPRPRASRSGLPDLDDRARAQRVRGGGQRLRLPRRYRLSPAPGSVIAIGWFVCFVAIMLAGLRPPPVVPDSRVEPEDTGTLGLLLPYVAGRPRARHELDRDRPHRADGRGRLAGAAPSSSRRWSCGRC